MSCERDTKAAAGQPVPSSIYSLLSFLLFLPTRLLLPLLCCVISKNQVLDGRGGGLSEKTPLGGVGWGIVWAGCIRRTLLLFLSSPTAAPHATKQRSNLSSPVIRVPIGPLRTWLQPLQSVWLLLLLLLLLLFFFWFDRMEIFFIPSIFFRDFYAPSLFLYVFVCVPIVSTDDYTLLFLFSFYFVFIFLWYTI
jgi:hypothetical protein